jgi:hypothetical protein
MKETKHTLNLLDLSVERTFVRNQIESTENAVAALLKPPALLYIRGLRRTINQDPGDLAFHEQSVGLKIQSFLSKEGIFWDQEIFEKQFLDIVLEAIKRERTSEK